eukprot:Selendium_serpulae@DN5630_c0_g1_i2.p1
MTSIFFDPTAFENDASAEYGDEANDEGLDPVNDDQAGAESGAGTKTARTKEAVIFAIELDESLFSEKEVNDHTKPSLDAGLVKATMWQEIMTCIVDVMKSRIIAAENDKFGVLLLGTGTCENDQKFPEIVDDDDIQIQPAGFHMIPLPFAEEIRHPKVSETTAIDESDVKLALSVIEALELEEFDPGQIKNPVITKHYGGIEALALGLTDVPEVEDDLLLEEEAVLSRKPKIYKWKEKVYGAVDIDLPRAATAVTKRKEPASATPRASKAAKASPDSTGDIEATVKKARENGTLEKLTVAQLKEWLAKNNLPVSGKKAVLLSRIE